MIFGYGHLINGIGLFSIFLMVGILGDIFGFLNISIVLIDTSINATIIALIVSVYIVITNGAILVFLQTGFAVK